MKKVFKILGILFLACVLLTASAGFYILKVYGPGFGIYLSKPSTETYMKQAITFMEQGIYAKGDAWEQKKAEMLAGAKACDSYEDCYDLIESGLKMAGGKHSKLLLTSPEEAVNEAPQVSRDENGILLVKLPAFMDGTKAEMEAYVKTVRDFFAENQDCKGIIVDLRGNTGGDSGPMLAAAAPILPVGTLLSFDIAGMKRDVVLDENQVSGSGTGMTFEPFQMPEVPVAVLQDEMTASSGEVVLLAFRGLSNVRTFGSASAGYASCNTVQKLYDGCRMLITIGYDVARTGEVFCEDPIEPDVLCDDPVGAAVEWMI